MPGRIPADRDTIRSLIAKHDRPGPRYTSYPTAVEFQDLEPGLYEKHLAAADALGERPLSLYVHLPFCEERCLFCGCHVLITKHRAKAEPYLDVLAREKLLGAGYQAIGMDHFAKPEDELARAKKDGRLRRNFQGYAVIPGDDVLGFGISAIGDVRGAMFQNEKKLSRYRDMVDAGRLPAVRGIVRSRDDEIRADVIHRLMCNFVIDIGAVEVLWGIDFRDTFARDLELLVPYQEEGLVLVEDESIRATTTGELFVRNLAMCFDRYMREKHAGEKEPVFSRTV